MAATEPPDAPAGASAPRRTVRSIRLPSGVYALVQELPGAPLADAGLDRIAPPVETGTRPAPPDDAGPHGAGRRPFRFPAVRLPKLTLPSFRLPDLRLPDLRVPGIRVPGIRAPGIGLPAAWLRAVRPQARTRPAPPAAARKKLPAARMRIPVDPGALVEVPGQPLPRGAVSGTLVTSDGVRLRVARFPATAQPNRGTVLLMQGRAEFIEKYIETAEDLGRRGLTVAGFDFRGQGRSQRILRNRRKGHVDDFSDYLLDVEAVMRGLVLPDCPPPYFVLAHSMGSLVALLAAAARPNWFDRMVLVAPFFGVPANRLSSVLKPALAGLDTIGLGAAYVPGGRAGPVHLRPFLGNPFTSDQTRYRRIARVLRAAPDLATGAPTVGWAQAALRAIRETTSDRFTTGLMTPVLAVSAGADKVVDAVAAERFGAALRGGGAVVLPNAQHEILAEREPFRDLFWAAFDSFIPGPSPFA